MDLHVRQKQSNAISNWNFVATLGDQFLFGFVLSFYYIFPPYLRLTVAFKVRLDFIPGKGRIWKYNGLHKSHYLVAHVNWPLGQV